MTTMRTNILCLAFIVIAVVTAAYLYPSLPDQIPRPFNIYGDGVDYISKLRHVLILLLMPIFVFATMRLAPVISPHGFRTEDFADTLNIFTVALVGFMSAVALLILLKTSGRNAYFHEMIYTAIGLLFIVMGNYLGKLRKNFFLGFRTPWTLASDEVWSRTHRFGGRVFVLIGFFVLLNAFLIFFERWVLTVALLVVGSLVPIIYSYALYRQLEGFVPDDTDKN